MNNNTLVVDNNNNKEMFAWCENLFVEQISSGFETQLDDILKNIRDEANIAVSYQDKQLFFKIYESLTANKNNIKKDFHSFLKKHFNDKVVDSQKKSDLTKVKFKELSLVSDSDVEKDISKKNLEKKIIESLGDELNNLSIRMEYLLGKNNVNPFVPDVLVSALISTIEKIFADPQLSFKMVDTFGSSFPETIRPTFKGMNEYLIANDVIVDVNTYKLNKNLSPISKNIEHPNVQKPIEKPFLDLDEELNNLLNKMPNTDKTINKNKINDIFNSLFSSGNNAQFHNSNQANGFLGGATHRPVSYTTMQSVNKLQNEIAKNQINDSSKMMDFLNNVNNMSGVGASFKPANIINQLSSGADNQYDRLIIELTSMIFDKLFSNEKIPEHIRFLIGKLQLPILKLALQNNEFFLNKESSPRQFLDKLSSPEVVYSNEYIGRISKVIDNLLLQEEMTTSFFSIALEQLKQIMQEQKDKEQIIITKSAAILEQDEINNEIQDEILVQLDVYTNKMTSKKDYEPVRLFIDNVWSTQFIKKWITSCTNKNDFVKSIPLEAKVQLNHSILVFDLIIWSAQIKEFNTENIQKLSQSIPKIKDGLNKICSDLSIPFESAEKLNFLLQEKHLFLMDKMTNQIKDDDVEKQSFIQENENNLIDSFKKIKNQTQKLQETDDEIDISKIDFDKIMEKGTWFDFISEKLKMKLLWASPKKTLFLFSNPKDKKVYRFDKSFIWKKYKAQQLVNIPLEKIDTEHLINSAVLEFKDKIENQ